MIHSVSFRNFKRLRCIDIALEQFSVFVGPNASGKTSILAGLYYLSQLSQKQPQELFKDDLHPRLLYTRGGHGQMQITVSTGKGSRRLTVVPPDISNQHIHYQLIMDNANSWQMNPEFSPDAKGAEKTWIQLWHTPEYRQYMSPAVLLQLEPARLASPSYSMEREPQLGRDGSGLASALVRMAGNRPDDFQELQKKLRRVIPSMRKVRFDRAPVRLRKTESDMLIEYQGDTIIFDFENAPEVPARLASDGTLLALAILTAAMLPDRPKLILLDNLENGLHPKAQKELIELLQTILDQNPDMQIVATTHSPYLVDIVKPEQVRITSLEDDGATACAPLVDHPDYEKWKDEMAPGEYWSLIGEKWVAKREHVVSQQ